MAPFVIAKLGATFPELSALIGDFDQWVVRGLAVPTSQVTVVDVPAGEPLPELDQCEAVVLTGSPEMLTAQPAWLDRASEWTARLVDAGTPTLGICFGHQLLAHAAGGKVGDNPRGREMGTVTIRLTDQARRDPLLGKLPSPMAAQVSHAQSVLKLPDGAVVLAGNDHDPHHAFRLGDCAWGVQFHPEFDPTATREYVRRFDQPLRDEGADPDRLLAAVTETPAAASVLRRFARYVQQRPRATEATPPSS